jgi:hypothetical protein
MAAAPFTSPLGSRHSRQRQACTANNPPLPHSPPRSRPSAEPELALLPAAALLTALAPSLPAGAEEAAAAAADTSSSGFDPNLLLAAAPIVLYGAFNVYRCAHPRCVAGPPGPPPRTSRADR